MEEQRAYTTVELDLRGEVCPATLLKSLREINVRQEALRAGKVRLAILTDNRYSTDTVSDAAASMGYRVLVSRERSWYRISVETED